MERVASYIPSAADKGLVISFGPPDGFKPTKPSPEIRERYDLPESFVLTVSNVSQYKKLVELVKGVAIARDRTDLPPLFIAGKVVDEDYEREVRKAINEHDLADHVQFLGFVAHDDLPELHAASDLFVFSSACENAPTALIEALACGSAIASSNRASMPDICDDAAAYFDPYDPADVGATLAALWDDPERRQVLEHAAVERAGQFDWDEAAVRTGKLLADLAR